MADNDSSPVPVDAIQQLPAPPEPSGASADKPERPAKRRLSPERFAAEIARLDRVLAALALAFAFLLASFVARNSDVWMRLATGRALAHGQYQFGVDPFAHTTGGVYWANHSWLYDWIVYQLTEASGGIDNPRAGAVLVVVKAGLMTLLAGVLLSLRRRGRSLWLPAACVALAVLVMSTRFLLQPMVVSFLFLGLTLAILVREGKQERTRETKGWRLCFTTAPARLYALPLLFLVWVNLDSWFLLGPATVALYLLGELLQQRLAPLSGPDAAEPEELRVLGTVLALGLVACLFSPHHYHAFALPAEFFPGAQFSSLQQDWWFHTLFYSALDASYRSPGIGGNVAGFAYFGLVVLGLASFGVSARDRRGWRLVLWLSFCVLSLWQARLIPFFAVVAAPITVLNFQDALARFGKTGLPANDRGRLWALGGRLLTLVGLVGLIGAAWPGWLQPNATNPMLARRVGWGIEVDPSLKKTAEKLREWRQQGILSSQSHGFNLTPDVANYCAWFCPEEKGFLDYRYALFRDAAADYVAVRKVLHPNPDPNDSKARRDTPSEPIWRKVFKERGIDHVILSGGNLTPTVYQMLNNPQEWTLLDEDGRTAIFGWREPRSPDALAAIHFDPHARAFGPAPDRAPAEGPGRPPFSPDWWQRYWEAPAPRSLDTDEAFMDLVYFETLSGRAQNARLRTWVFASAAGCVSAGGLAGGAMATPAVVTEQFGGIMDQRLSETLVRAYLADHDRGPPGAPLIALRAARRGLAANPDDAAAYLNLAKAANVLWRNQENAWARSPPASRMYPPYLGQIRQVFDQRRQPIDPLLSPWVTRSTNPRQLMRQVQLVWALEQALALKGDAQVAYQALADGFWQMGYYDLALEHRREAFKLFKAGGPVGPTMEAKKQFDEQVKGQEQFLQDFEKEVQDLRTDFELHAATLAPMAKAVRAFYPFGLAKQALALMQEADLTQFSRDEADFYIYLLLTTGQLDKLSAGRLGTLVKELKGRLGSQYDWYQTFLAAGVGDYQQAGQSLDQVLADSVSSCVPALVPLLYGLTADRMQTPVLARVMLAPFTQTQIAQGRAAVVTAVRLQSDLHVLRGLLALDAGDTKTAQEHFRGALRVAGSNVDFESRPIAVRYLELLTGKASGEEGKNK